MFDWAIRHKGIPNSRGRKTDATFQVEEGVNYERGVNSQRQ